MDALQYVDLLKERLTAAFDFKQTPQELGLELELWAVHNRFSEKYFLAKSISLYSIKNDEYVGIQITQNITPHYLNSCSDQFKRLIAQMVVDENHMSSIFTLALVSTKPVTTDVLATLKSIKFHKDFMFTLRGWADFALIVIDLPNRKIYTNPFGQKMKKNYEWS